MRVLGVNAVFHDPAAALVIDGTVVAAAEEERFTRRKHGHANNAFAAWEVPEQAMRWCLAHAGIEASDLDAVAYSFDPALCDLDERSVHDPWEWLRVRYAERAPQFLATALPGLDPAIVRFVPHHLAHAASAGLGGPDRDAAVLVLDGRGESASGLTGRYRDGELDVLSTQPLPHSLGLLYEDLTAHLGFHRSSDEYKVMALASYGTPRFLPELRKLVRTTGDGGFVTEPIDWGSLAKARRDGEDFTPESADLASSVQRRLEEVLLELAGWLHDATGARTLAMAGGVALNCVANSRLFAETKFDHVWVQPAAGDGGTALGAALAVAHDEGDRTSPMPTPALGRGWDDDQVEELLIAARVPYERPHDVAQTVAETLAGNGVVAWFQGRSEYGPRALGHRSLLAHPGHADNVERLNDVKGREQFRPVAPMVLASRASEIFHRGPLPSPYMLFVHDVPDEWRARIPAVVHIDGTARAQTVDPADEPLVARMLERFDALTGLPCVINTSLNTAGRPMVDSPQDALELFGSAPVDLLAIGAFVVRRP